MAEGTVATRRSPGNVSFNTPAIMCPNLPFPHRIRGAMSTPAATTATRYRWATAGDINAFFGLMLDNVMNLVILAGILIFVFGFPEDLVYTRMFPGTALGVMFGDLVYTWMAFRLAKREGR